MGPYITGGLLPSCDRTGCCDKTSAGAVRSLNMVSVRSAVGLRAVHSAGLNAFSQSSSLVKDYRLGLQLYSHNMLLCLSLED